jgi:hypothetical protein
MADYNSSYTGAQIDDGVGRAIVRNFGWQDFQDTATPGTPIPLTAANTWYDLTNDANGALTSTQYKVATHGTIWDSSTNTIDFSTLAIGDTVRFRTDVSFVTSGANHLVETRFVFGPSFNFSIPFDGIEVKSATTKRRIRYWSFTIKNADTRDNPGKFQARSDATGDSVFVGGWQIETQVFVP